MILHKAKKTFSTSVQPNLAATDCGEIPREVLRFILVARVPCLSRLDAVVYTVYTLGAILSKSLCSPGLTLTREHGRKYKLYCGVLMAAKSRKDRNLPEIRPPWICTVISREEGE